MVQKVVMVTGGSGLVGKAIEHVVKEEKFVEEKWVFLSSKDGDLSFLNDTKEIFEKYKPSHVIHLAAMVGGLFHNMSNNLEFLRKNMKINDNVLLCCHESGVEKVVSCLSTCIFPDKTSYPIDETMVHLGPPHGSNYGYSYAKRLIDITNHAYADQYNHKFTSVIPCNVYGPFDNFNLQSSHVIPGLMRRLHDAMQQNEETFTVFGSGKPVRQFIYSYDLAKLMIWTLRNYDEIDPIILSVDERDEISISDVAHTIAKAFNYKGNLIFDTNASDGQMKKTANNAKLRKFLPDFRFTPIEDGICQTVKWFQENYSSARV